MNDDGSYRMLPVSTPGHWRLYHDMRRRILWENRGKFGVYEKCGYSSVVPGSRRMGKDIA